MGSVFAVIGYIGVQFFWRRHKEKHPQYSSPWFFMAKRKLVYGLAIFFYKIGIGLPATKVTKA